MSITDPDLLAKGPNGHSCFGIISQITPQGQVLVVTLMALEKGILKLEFPGGTGIGGETPLATLAREVSSEVVQDEKPLEIKKTIEIRKNLRPGDLSKGGGTHTQYFFLIDLVAEPVYRLEPKVEPDGTVLEPPKWIDIGEFINHSKTKFAHRQAARDFLCRLEKKSKKILAYYQELL